MESIAAGEQQEPIDNARVDGPSITAFHQFAIGLRLCLVGVKTILAKVRKEAPYCRS